MQYVYCSTKAHQTECKRWSIILLDFLTRQQKYLRNNKKLIQFVSIAVPINMSEDQPPGSPEPKFRAERTKSLAAHTTSVPLETDIHPPNASQLSRGTSLRVREKAQRDQDEGGGNRGSWSFGSVGKVVGLFGSGVVQGTKAVGSGVVSGTKAVGTGVVQGTKAVGTGVVTTTKVVGTGVVQGTMAVGTGVVEGGKAAGRVTVAAGKGVITAGEIVGSAAVSGATAVGTATKDVGSAVANTTTSAITDSTKWVKEQSESFSHEFASTHTLLPDQTLAEVANQHGCSIHNIIRINQLLSRRQLRPGKELLIPLAGFLASSSHQLETLGVKGTFVCSQVGPGNVGNEMLKGMKSLAIDGSVQPEHHKDGMLNFTLHDFTFQPVPQSGGARPQSSGGRPQSRDGRSPSRQQIQMMSSSMSSNNSSFSNDPIVTISTGQISRIWAEFSADSSNKDRVPELLPAGSARAMKNKNDFKMNRKGSDTTSNGALVNKKHDCENSPPLKTISSLEGGGGSPPTECVVVELDMEKQLEELNNSDSQGCQDYEYVYITIATSTPSPRGSRNISESTNECPVFNEEDEDEMERRSKSPGSVVDASTEKPCTARYLLEVAKYDCVSLMNYFDLWYQEILDIDLPLKQYLEAQVKDDDMLYDTDGPSVLDVSHFLSEQMQMGIYLKLPHIIQNQHWSLAYSTEKHGFSLHNLYRTVADDPEPFIIAILDNCGQVFGAFLTCTPQMCANFIGTGRSWLFAYSDEDEEENGKINIFHWSGKNEYFFRGSSDSLVIGAAEGKFGILVDADLHRGRIQECSTFENWPIQEGDFTIKCLECWKFV